MEEIKDSVYWSGIEYKHNEKSPDYNKSDGGFVYVFVKAFDVQKSLELINKSLNKLKLDPYHIEFLMPYDTDMEWETPKQSKYYLNLYNMADKSSQVIFDDLYEFEK